jgi:dCMP deaminase
MRTRISWEEYALRIAEVAAQRSEDIHIQVGACVLNSNNRIVGVGYNGLAPNKNVDPKFWNDRDYRRKFILHAEANALNDIKMGEGELLACTLLPCSSCATLIAAKGIKRVIYRELYNRDTNALEIFKFYNISCEKINADREGFEPSEVVKPRSFSKALP